MDLHNYFNMLQKEVAPVSLSDEYCALTGFKDNSGIILDAGNNVTGVLFSLDFSPSAAEYAVNNDCNLIVTHHPAIFHGIRRLDTSSDPLSKSLSTSIKHGISVISMHLNFDAAPCGIDRYLMEGLGGKSELAIMHTLSAGGYGRVYDVISMPFKAYCDKVKEKFNTDRMLIYGHGQEIVRRVASFCGAGCDEESIAFALEYGADTFVSSDMKHHNITALMQAGCKVIQLTHYASENYGFEKISKLVASKSGLPTFFFADREYL